MTPQDSGKRRTLGRGLSALLGDDGGTDYAAPEPTRASRAIPVELIEPGRFQPRRNFDKDELAALTQSVREHGVLQPILVRQHPDDPTRFELIAGERRWLAAQAAQLHEIPVVVKDLGDKDVLEIALVENIQRQDLSPLEEAAAYQRLITEFGHTQEDLGDAVGKSRSHVANTLRLLQLPEPVKKLIDEGQLSAGHARALLGAKDVEGLAKKVVARGLNVRQTEALVKSGKGGAAERAPAAKTNGAAGKSPDTLALEHELTNLLGLTVEIREHGATGELVIRYKSLEQLDDVLQRLSRGSL